MNTRAILPESLHVGNMPMCGKFSVVWCKSAFNTVQMKNCTCTVPKSFGIAFIEVRMSAVKRFRGANSTKTARLVHSQYLLHKNG